jgi:SAM-dependent methyltransferase
MREHTAARFAYEWNEFREFDHAEEVESMATWFRPRRLEDLAGLTVLEAGCGMGRHAVIAARYGAARVVGFDLGESVEAAFANTRHLEGVCIVQGDIYYPPVKHEGFDAAYSLGVLHHLPDPRKGFAALAPKVRQGGWLQVWLYGREGNDWIIYLINPIRWGTARMPLSLLKVLTWAMCLTLAAVTKSLYRAPGLGLRLPYAPYMRWLSGFSIRKIHAIVLDHALAPVSHYMRRADVEALVDLPGWSIAGLEHSRSMSWGMEARRLGTIRPGA